MSFVNTADRLIGEEMARSRVKRREALARVARSAGLMPGTVANFVRGRLKNSERAERALTGLLVVSIERKISELETELVSLRASGGAAGAPDIASAEALLEEARRCLRSPQKEKA